MTSRPRGEWFRGFFDGVYLDILADQKTAAASRREVDFIVGALALRPGARILDLPCGYGRHASELARRGFEVLGEDLSPAMIRKARRRFGGTAGVTFRRADMRRLAYREEFDAVINMYNGFGYFGRRQDAAVLRRLGCALRPGGRLLIDQRDPERDQAEPIQADVWRTDSGTPVRRRLRFDPGTGETEVELLLPAAGRRREWRRTARFRQYRLWQWLDMLGTAGLRLASAYSGYDGRSYRPGRGTRLIVLGERP